VAAPKSGAATNTRTPHGTSIGVNFAAERADTRRVPQPRSFLVTAKAFGRHAEAEWLDDRRTHLVLAAQLQHAIATRVTDRRNSLGVNVTTIANRFHAHPDTVRRKLYGHQWATLPELAQWLTFVEPERVAAPAPADLVST
jgi:hypothetical protein